MHDKNLTNVCYLENKISCSLVSHTNVQTYNTHRSLTKDTIPHMFQHTHILVYVL